MTQAYLLEKYGPRLNLDDLAEVLCIKKNTVYNQRARGTFPIKTYVDGQPYADYRDVAEYFDACRERAQ